MCGNNPELERPPCSGAAVIVRIGVPMVRSATFFKIYHMSGTGAARSTFKCTDVDFWLQLVIVSSR